jgi:hypothetical protein
MKHTILYLLLLAPALTACATTPSNFSQQENGSALQAAAAGDAARLRTILDGKTLTSFDRFDLIRAAITNRCHPEVVEFVLAKKADPFEPILKEEYGYWENLRDGGVRGTSRITVERPGAYLVSLAARQSCVGALKAISEKTTPEDFAAGLYKSQRDFNSSFSKATTESYLSHIEKAMFRENEDAETRRIADTALFAVKRIESDCANGGGESCTAKAEWEKVKAGAEATAKGREHALSPEGIMEQACEAYGNMMSYLGLIQEEREKAKISGYENKLAIKSWGDSAHRHRQELENSQAHYRDKTKKTINPKKDCALTF